MRKDNRGDDLPVPSAMRLIVPIDSRIENLLVSYIQMKETTRKMGRNNQSGVNQKMETKCKSR
jgi:hypothetical protein